MQSRQLHRNVIPLCLASISVWGVLGGSAAVAVEGMREAGQTVVAQNDAIAEAERLLEEGLRLYGEGGIESLQQAIQVWERASVLFHGGGNQAQEAAALSNIALVYDALGEIEKALDYYNRALPLRRAAGDRAGEAVTLVGIGGAYDTSGEKQKALEYYERALALFRAVEDRRSEAITLNNIGAIYSDLGEKQKALDYYNRALPLRQATGDRSGEAITLNNMGVVYNDLGERRMALDYHNRALTLHRAAGNRRSEAVTLNNIGRVHSDLGEKQKALDYYNRALPLRRAAGDRGGEATTLNNIAAIYDDLGEKRKALDYYEQALSLLRAVGNRQGEATLRGNLAILYRQQNQLPQALENINAAIALIEDLRTKIDNDDLRTSYFATVQSYYQFKTDLLMQLKQPQEAFNTNERSRSRTLLELLNTTNINIREGANPQLLERERQLRQQLQTIETRRVAILSQGDNENLTQSLQSLDLDSNAVLENLEQLLTQIRRTNPAYADLKQPQPLTLPQIQQQVLDPETVLLQYSLGEQKSYLWVVSHNTFNAYELPGKATLAQPIQMFRSATATNTSQNSVKRKGDELVKLILPTPVWAQIAGKRLLFVGDGDLLTIPFAALPVPDATEYTPLLQRYEIFDQPSTSAIAILRQQTQNRRPAPKTLALLADPVYSSDDPRVINRAPVSLPAELASTLRSIDRANINRLPNTRREAEQILALLPKAESNAVLDFAADRAWATNPQLSQYRILHFATHGFVNEENPAFSGIVLSLVNANGLVQPGFLRLNDIFNLNLPAELVVLSACQTGLGKTVGGEGLVGLTRGFMYAGTKRLVVSLWNVNDEATADLMVAMYGKMFRENLTPAAALRAAQLEMWQAKKSPYLWAAFTVRGEWKNGE